MCALHGVVTSWHWQLRQFLPRLPRDCQIGSSIGFAPAIWTYDGTANSVAEGLTCLLLGAICCYGY